MIADPGRQKPGYSFPSRVTIATICYGDNSHLAETFLRQLYSLTSPNSFELRIGLNEVVPRTLELVEHYVSNFGNIQIYDEPRNIFKGPLMRRMFREKPLTDEWVIWFDDDSRVTRGDWLQRLALKIEREPWVAQWGQPYELFRSDAEIVRFIESAPWYRGLPLPRGTAPDGRDAAKFVFLTGGFWAMKTEVIRALDWPDPRLIQANDDFLLGEALRQNGYAIGSFDRGVCINDHPRRNAEAPEVQRLVFE